MPTEGKTRVQETEEKQAAQAYTHYAVDPLLWPTHERTTGAGSSTSRVSTLPY